MENNQSGYKDFDLNDFVIRHIYCELNLSQRVCVINRQKQVFGMGENLLTLEQLSKKLNVGKAYAHQTTMRSKRIINNRLVQISKLLAQNKTTPLYVPRTIFDFDSKIISRRLLNCLRNEGIIKLDDITNKPKKEFLKIPNFGRGTLKELAELLSKYDLTLKD